MTKSVRRLQPQVFGTLKAKDPSTEVGDPDDMLRRKTRDAVDNLELGNPINFVPVMQVKKFACKRVMTYLVLIGLGVVAHSMYRIFFTTRNITEVNESVLETIVQEKKNLNEKPSARILDDPPELHAKDKVNEVFEEYKKKMEELKNPNDENEDVNDLGLDSNDNNPPEFIPDEQIQDSDNNPPEFIPDEQIEDSDKGMQQFGNDDEFGNNDDAAFGNQDNEDLGNRRFNDINNQDDNMQQASRDRFEENRQFIADQDRFNNPINDNLGDLGNQRNPVLNREDPKNLMPGNDDQNVQGFNPQNEAQINHMDLPDNDINQNSGARAGVGNNQNDPPGVVKPDNDVERDGIKIVPNADAGSSEIKKVAPQFPAVKNPDEVDLDTDERLNKLPEKVNVELGWRPLNPARNQQPKKEHFHELPTLVSAAADKDMDGILQLIQSVQKFIPGEKLFIYDLGLSVQNKRKLVSLCGVRLKDYMGGAFPDFFQKLENFHWRPLVIQSALSEFGHMTWINPTSRLINTLNALVEKSDKNGILLIGTEEVHSSNAVTSPAMLKYIPTDQKKFKVSSHITMSAMILHNRPEVQDSLMRPWMACAIEQECMAPTGSKWKCYFDFTGLEHAKCHRYDESALNLLLKNRFDYRNSDFYVNKNSYFDHFDTEVVPNPRRCKNPNDLQHIK